MIFRYLFTIALAAAPVHAVEVEWARVAAGGYSASLRVPGRIVAQEGALSVESARVQGRVTGFLRREGERVAAGEPLFVISSPECLSLANEKAVAQSRGLSDLIEAAKRREEQMGLSVSESGCRVLASHDGTLASRQVQMGAAFNVGDALVTILDVSRLNVELDVPERNLHQVRAGQRVRVELASAPGEAFVTTVDSVLPMIDAAARTGRARLKPGRLPEGATLDALAFAEVDTGVKQRAFKVPASAIVFSRNKQYVVKKEGAVAVAVPVDVVGESESTAVVRVVGQAELKIGDEIAVKGAIYMLKQVIDG